MQTIGNLKGSSLVDAGDKGLGDCLTVPEGHHALWIVDGRAVWTPDLGSMEELSPSNDFYELVGPGLLTFVEATHYAWFDHSDALGFGPRAELYQVLLEPRNREVGQALTRDLVMGPGQIWVDIGTGTGAMVRALQERARSSESTWILGIDGARQMVEQAWQNVQDVPPAWFVSRDLSAMNWPQSRFDGVTALLLLHLVDNIDDLVGHVFRALRPGGRFLYAVSADNNPFVQMIMRQISGPGDFFKRGQKGIRQSVLAAGFTVIRQETYRDEIILERPEDMKNLILSIGGPASRGLRSDMTPPSAISRSFDLIWAEKPRGADEA